MSTDQEKLVIQQDGLLEITEETTNVQFREYRTEFGDIPLNCTGEIKVEENERQREFISMGQKTDRCITKAYIKEFQCDICSKTFTQHSNLMKHILIHTGEKPHQCNICCKRFTQQANLSKHIMTHTGIKPYQCKMCNRAFSQQANLKKHIQLHTGEKTYCCEFCGKSFVQQVNLDRHKRIHAGGERPLTCDICNETFAQSGNLMKHKVKHGTISRLGVVQIYSRLCENNADFISCDKMQSVQYDDNREHTTNELHLQSHYSRVFKTKDAGVPVIISTKKGVILKRL